MCFKNTETEYGLLSKGFHWVIALIIFALCLAGLAMTEMENSPDKFRLYGLHKSFGILVLILVALRLSWRFYSPPPNAPDHHAGWEKGLAKATHLFLYFAMFAIPLSGWIMSSAGGHPVSLFGLELPPLVEKDNPIGKTAHQMHTILGLGIIVLIALHAAGAFKHHFIDKDDTLFRMTFAKKQIVAFVLAAMTGAFLLLAGYLFLTPGSEEKPESEQVLLETGESKSDPA